MKYINEVDYNYVMNKYHDLSKPFNQMNRFILNDDIFDTESGLSADEIAEKLTEQDEKLRNFAPPIRKAKAFELVLKNTRISCDKRDIFPAIHLIHRPLNKTVLKNLRKEYFRGIILEVDNKRMSFERNGICTVWPDFDHSVPYWDRCFALGFKGLLCKSEEARKKIKNITEEQTGFFDGIKITYEAILMFIDRLIIRAEYDGNQKLLKALINLKDNAPKTFYEVLLFDYLYFMLSEHIEGLQVRSLCNFDRLLFPYFKSDLENGMSEEEIRSELTYFLLQFASIDNYWNQPVFLGGCKEDESTEINELSYLFLDVYDELNILNPKIQIKIAPSTPKDFILKSLDMIRRGHNCIVFLNDTTVRKALMKIGHSNEEARLCNIKGCYEYSVQGAMDIGMNYFNLLKPLEYTLHEGCDGITKIFGGRKCKKAEEFKSFEEFYEEYKNQLLHIIDLIVENVNIFEEYLASINPMNMLAATYPTSIESGKDPLFGGSTNNDSIILFGFIANIADSLSNIKKYVFDRKLLSLAELRDILDKDFEGEEKLRLVLLNDKDKFGNNKELPDFFAKDIAEFINQNLSGRPNNAKRGGKWGYGFHVARQSYDLAGKTASSPDGRLRGQELSKNVSASMGQNKEGATAAILSTTKIDATASPGDVSLDLGLLPSAVKGEDGLEAMYTLLMTFIKRGGHALHINVFDADTLRAAQKEPEKYKDLQIRVCGWNVLFNNISKEEQDGFIRQAEGLV